MLKILSLVLLLGGSFATLPPIALAAPSPAAAAAETSKPAAQLKPNAQEKAVASRIADILTHHHYGKRPLNDALSAEILDRYLKSLDPNRSYFVRDDIADFNQYRDKLDDAIRDDNLQPAFDIYTVYQHRVEQRVNYALNELQQEPDFTVKESYRFDRTDAPWAQNEKDLDNIWRKRVKNDAIGLLLAGKTWNQARDVLRKRYLNFLHRTRQINSQDVFDAFMNAYAHSMDPHTDYFSPEQSAQFQIQMSLKLQGIGAALQSEDQYVKVVRVIPGGPAEKSGKVHPGDRITGVAQGDKGDMVDVVGWRLDDVVELIRGNKGSVVRLQILPAGAPPGSQEETVRLVRDTIKLEERAAHKKIITLDHGGRKYAIGVITVPSFYMDFKARIEGDKNYTSTTRDVDRLLQELKKEKVDGIVLDMRDNGGGSLEEATELTGLFIKEGPVVQLKNTAGDIDVQRDTDASISYGGPLGVLVNRFSASATEIFAGAIQDYHRGVIIGQTTYGKGTVQTLVDLNRFLSGDNNAGQLKLTIGKFYRVTGSSTQDIGVEPDIALPSPIDPKEFGEDTEDNALPWDRIGPAHFSPVHEKVEETIPQLRTDEEMRTGTDPAFALYLQEIKQIQAEHGRKSVSLVLADRKQEREKTDADALSRANAWRKLSGKAPVDSLQALRQTQQATGTTAAASVAGQPENPAEPDVVLKEAARIVLDLSRLTHYPGEQSGKIANDSKS